MFSLYLWGVRTYVPLFKLLFVKVCLFVNRYVHYLYKFTNELFLCILYTFLKKYCHFIVISFAIFSIVSSDIYLYVFFSYYSIKLFICYLNLKILVFKNSPFLSNVNYFFKINLESFLFHLAYKFQNIFFSPK